MSVSPGTRGSGCSRASQSIQNPNPRSMAEWWLPQQPRSSASDCARRGQMVSQGTTTGVRWAADHATRGRSNIHRALDGEGERWRGGKMGALGKAKFGGCWHMARTPARGTSARPGGRAARLCLPRRGTAGVAGPPARVELALVSATLRAAPRMLLLALLLRNNVIKPHLGEKGSTLVICFDVSSNSFTHRVVRSSSCNASGQLGTSLPRDN